MVDEYDTKSNSTVELLPQDDDGIENKIDPTTDSVIKNWGQYKKDYPTDWQNALRSVTDAKCLLSYTIDDKTLEAIDFSGSEKVTNTCYMFGGQRKLSAYDNLMDTKNVTNMSYMFSECIGLERVTIDITNLSNARSMFEGCTKLKKIIFIGDGHLFATNDSAMYLFSACRSLENPPLFYRPKGNATGMFRLCEALKEIPAYDMREVTSTNSVSIGSSWAMLYGCTNLEKIHFTGLRVKLDISSSTKFTREALVEILTNLGQASGGSQTLTMGETNLAKLTADDIAIATAKGWTLQ